MSLSRIETLDVLTPHSVTALVENQENPFNMELFDQSFIDQYRKLVKLEETWCARKDATVTTGGGRAPDTVILDVWFHSRSSIQY